MPIKNSEIDFNEEKMFYEEKFRLIARNFKSLILHIIQTNQIFSHFSEN